MSTTSDIYVNGVLLPPCIQGGVILIPHKLWSSSSGRNNCTGEFVGDLVTIKWEIQLSWEDLTDEEFAVIDAAVNSLAPFVTVKFYTKAGTQIERQFYSNDPQYPILKCTKNGTRYSTVTATLIQK